MGLLDQIAGALGGIVNDVVKATAKEATRQLRRTTSPARKPAAQTGRRAPKLSRTYPGDYRGRPAIQYDPHTGKVPDPGEVVWAWVPFEENHKDGKDRPALLIGRDGDWMLAIPFSSVTQKEQESATGQHWVEVGRGAWDTRARTSYARVDRIVRIHPDDVRGRAEKLDKERFDKVAAGVRSHNQPRR